MPTTDFTASLAARRRRQRGNKLVYNQRCFFKLWETVVIYKGMCYTLSLPKKHPVHLPWNEEMLYLVFKYPSTT
jgi:hypothetical protein